MLIYGASDNGAFQRQHTASDWLIGAAICLAIGAIWPYAAAVFFLTYFGILPK
jgi:hypothetical protein